MLPKLNRRRALFVLTKIDKILAWEKQKDTERDIRFVELGRYLCEVRAGQYWRVENVKSFDEFLVTVSGVEKEGVLPDVDSRAPATTGEEGPEGGGLDERVGVDEDCEKDRQAFDCATWLHKAREMPKEQFKQISRKSKRS
jgi:hypothetical protein